MTATRTAFPIHGAEPVVLILEINQSREEKISMHLHFSLDPNLQMQKWHLSSEKL